MSDFSEPRRPKGAAMPPAPMQPKLAKAPRNPYAFKNRTHGKGVDMADCDWQSPSQANDWDSEWRPPGWHSPNQDAEFREEDVKRDQGGKFSKQAGGAAAKRAPAKKPASQPAAGFAQPPARQPVTQKTKEVGNQIIRDIKRDSFLNSWGVSTLQDLGNEDEPLFQEKPDGSIEFGLRDIGRWENPPGKEDEEDYDWQQPTEKTMKELVSLAQRLEKQHNVKVSFGAEEKNWMWFKIKPAQDANPFAEHNINRDRAGKFSHQRQLHHARDRGWRSPRQDQPTVSERNLIEDARIKALDMAHRLMGRDTITPVRLASDARLMAFDRALVGHTLKSQTMRMAMDQSMRTFSTDGHMHIAHNRLSRASVNPYLGSEIPNSEELGLDPRHKYMLLRHPDELAKAAASFNGLPVLIDHRPISADDHPSDLVVGSTGDSAKWEAPFLTNSLHIWSQPAIDAITKNERREISCAYHYVPVMQRGVYEGKAFDGVMTQIQGNHVALVPDGRVGPAATVADSMPFDLAVSEWWSK